MRSGARRPDVFQHPIGGALMKKLVVLALLGVALVPSIALAQEGSLLVRARAVYI